jgi:hypothetical protein
VNFKHPRPFFRRALLVALPVILAVCLISCASSDAVATFAGAAAKSLDQGTAIFDDMPASVLRRDCDANIEKREFDFKPAAEACITDAAERNNLGDAKKERDDLVAVQKVLIDYFAAMQQLAAFGKTTDSGGKSQSSATQAGSAATHLKTTNKLTSSDEVSAVTTLAEIVARVFTAGYRNGQLSRDIAAAEKVVPVVTAALTHIVRTDYMFDPDDPSAHSLLDLEANRMREQYRDAEGGRLLLRISWTDRVGKLLARNSSAQSYVEALEKIQNGHHQLATQPTQLKAPGLASALQPYISDLQSLITKIQKVF